MEHLWTALFCTIHLCLGYLAGRSGRGAPTDGVAAAATVLMPALSKFERAYGVLQPSLSQMPSEFQAVVEELKAWSAERLPEYGVPRMIKLLEAIPAKETLKSDV